MTRLHLPLATIAFAALAPLAQAGEWFFVYKNNSDYNVAALYVGAESQTGWGSELLGGGGIPAGESRSITVKDGFQDCKYDVYATYAEGFGGIQESIDMCTDGTIVEASNEMSPDYAASARGNP